MTSSAPFPTTVVILAAGIGSRLGRPHPKPLTMLRDGRTILGRQIALLRDCLGEHTQIIVVVGFKHGLIMEQFPNVLYAYNERFDTTNTSKSLLRGLSLAGGSSGVLWLNGDVVFDDAVIAAMGPCLEADRSFVCIRECHVGEEEVTFSLDETGGIRKLRKGLPDGPGEAVGINYVASNARAALIDALERCPANAYFEVAIEDVVLHGHRFVALDIGPDLAVEVDFDEDLTVANSLVGESKART